MSLSLIPFIGTYGKPKVRVIALMLAVLSFGIYAGTIGHGYNMDDVLVTQGHHLTSKGFSAIGQIFISFYYEDEMGYNYEYRPMTHLSFVLEHELFGEHPWMSHLVNVILHSLTVLLVFVVSRMILPEGGLLFSSSAALLFTVHPMHTEAVASIKNRDELLALMFALLAFIQSWKFASGGWWRVVPAAALLMMSLLSKVSAASFFVIIPLSTLLRPHDLLRGTVLFISLCSVFVWFLELRGVSHRFFIPLVWWCSALLMFVLWQWSRRVHWRAVGMWLLPKRVFRVVELIPRWSPADPRDIVVALVALTAGSPLLISGDLIWLSLPLGILLFAPYWSGGFGIAMFCILNAITLISVYSYFNATLGMLLMTYLVHVLPSAHLRLGQRLLLFNAIAITLLVTVSDFMQEMGILATEGHGDDIAWWPGLLFFVPIWPVVPVSIVYWCRGRLEQMGVLKLAGGVLVVMSVMYTLLMGWSLDSIMLSVSVLLGYPVLTNGSFPNRSATTLVLAAMMTLGHVGMTLMYDSPFEGLDSKVTETPTFANDEQPESWATDEAAAPSLSDRPLAFSEYPLGIDATVGERIGTASLILGHYLKMMFIPWPQAFYYGYNEVPLGDWMNPLAVLSLLVHAVLLLLAIYFGRSHPILAFGILAYLSSIFLFSNFLATIPGMIGDRLTYVASFGFCMSFGYVITLAYQRLSTVMAKRVFMVAIGALLVTWSSMTVSRAAKWKDPLTLMRHDISTVPNSAQTHNLLASNLMQASYDAQVKENSVDMRYEAIQHFRESLRIWPNTLNVWYDLGRAYMTVNEPARALPCFRSAYGFDSTFTDAAWNAALIADQLGQDSTAIQYYNYCIRFSPELEEAYSRLSYLYFTKEEFERSIEVNRMAIANEPRWLSPYENAAQVFEAMEMPDSVAFYIGKRNKMLGMP
jgi:hypothetical protein